MCIAIYKPKDKIIPKDVLETCWNVNDDGAGFMYAENKKLHIKKGYMDFESFYNEYKEHQHKNAVIHFRITTHGETNEDNTHPFVVGDNLAFVHNGIISAVSTADNTKFSDTYHFNKKILNKLYMSDNRFIKKQHFKDLIKEYVGYSKLVFMDNKGRVTIINEASGTWDDGVWYSNGSYKRTQYTGSCSYNPQSKYTRKPRYKTTYQDQKVIHPAIWEPLKMGDRVYVQITDQDEPRYGNISYFGDGLEIGVKLDDELNVLVFDSSKVYRAVLPKDIGDPKVSLFDGDDMPFAVGDWVEEKVTRKIGEIIYMSGSVANVNFSTNAEKEYRFVNKANLELFYRPDHMESMYD